MLIREMTAADLDAVAGMESENFTTPWKKDDFADLLDCDDRGCMVAEEEGEIVGCVVYHDILGDVDITNVQVKEAFRGRSIGRKLMEAALEKARSVGGKEFTLEVRASNKAAISLYESLGFVEEGKRKNFYSDPVEDAIIMWLR
ncbi:MAG: ribosomal protein S18-alanine N-acetyltransferase [Lachnospiraceae bacterium]|nr:ribosomal protein S18-alanine N-acetyltransferase [Lachnospiraceae bacterium]